MKPKYPMGAKVTFINWIADVHNKNHGKETIADGLINGPPVEGKAGFYIPVWSTPLGLEPQTVYVHETNVLNIEREEKDGGTQVRRGSA